MSCRSQRYGITLIELLVVIAILAVLMGLAVPAVQKARTMADRLRCANNLKQIGVALHAYHQANGGFPPAVWTKPDPKTTNVHWIPYIFPYVELENLYKEYDFTVRWNDPVNDDGVNQTKIGLLLCPAAPPDRKGAKDRGVTDYSATCGVDRKTENPFLNPDPKGDPTFLGVLGHNVSRKLTEVRDGTSNTMMVAEDAGQIQVWQMGKLISPNGGIGGWANPLNRLKIAGFNPLTETTPGPCAVNCYNNGEIYGFHPAGANILFADGSVHTLRASLDLNIAVALLTRDRGEEIPPDIYY